jgi:hypothetical protein
VLSLSVVLNDCTTVRPIPSPQKGSLENPLCSDGAAAQRLYLRRLRTDDGRAIRYEREAPVPGPDRSLLDPYRIWPEDGGGLFEAVNLLFRNEDPEKKGIPYQRRLYMNLYRPGCTESEAPPGLRLSEQP